MSDTLKHRGHMFTVEYFPDEDTGPPWEHCDGHGIVSDWTRRDKSPGERVLCEDRGLRRYYDIAETQKIARRDGWGPGTDRLPHETTRAYAARAVEADFEYLRRYCAGLWQYVWLKVTHDASGEVETLGGCEDIDLDYLMDEARNLADVILDRVEVEAPLAQLSEN